jgi:hypothetical protein
MRIAIFRKDAEVKYTAKASAKATAPILTMLAATSRFDRPEMIQHFLPTGKGKSAFAKQATVTRAELHHLGHCTAKGIMTPEAEATLAKAWFVPAEEIGRKPKNGERDYNSAGQSILIYAKRIGAICSDHDMVTVDPYGSDVSTAVVN